MTLTAIMVLAFATWRVAYMLINEEGPLAIFSKFRTWIGVEEEADQLLYGEPRDSLIELFSCIYCASVWVAAFFVIAYLLLPTITFYVALAFSLSAWSIVWERILSHD